MIDKCYIIPVQKACNCDCTFCISKTRDYSKKNEFLEVDDYFIENIYLLKKRNIRKIEITGGGEPYLHPNLDLIVSIIKRIIPDAYIKVYTNGFIMRKIDGIDEINMSLVSDEDSVNNEFMCSRNQCSFMSRLKYLKENYSDSKLRLSIPLIKGGVDSEDKLMNLINNTKSMVSEYVVRTLYPNCQVYDSHYVEFSINIDDVIYEKDNDVSYFDGLILWSDNKFYRNFELDSRRYMYSYLLLKPDSSTYINEIEDIIMKANFEIKKRYLLTHFKDIAMNFYQEKDENYKKVIRRHIEMISYLFGDNALIYILDKDVDYETLCKETYELKLNIRKLYGFTESKNGYLLVDGNLSHLNLCHCCDSDISYFDRDMAVIEAVSKVNLSQEEYKRLKRCRSYYI